MKKLLLAMTIFVSASSISLHTVAMERESTELVPMTIEEKLTYDQLRNSPFSIENANQLTTTLYSSSKKFFRYLCCNSTDYTLTRNFFISCTTKLSIILDIFKQATDERVFW